MPQKNQNKKQKSISDGHDVNKQNHCRKEEQQEQKKREELSRNTSATTDFQPLH